MKISILRVVFFMLGLSGTLQTLAQEKYRNQIFAEYGILQYNAADYHFLNKDHRFLSGGLGYNLGLSEYFSIGIKTKYYRLAQAISPSHSLLGANTLQADFGLHLPLLNQAYQLKTFRPYIVMGIGYAAVHQNDKLNQIDEKYAFIPITAGIDYNLSSKWALGVSGEYRLTAKKHNSWTNQYDDYLNVFNAASVRLTYRFGFKNARSVRVQQIYSRIDYPQALKQNQETKILTTANNANTAAMAKLNSTTELRSNYTVDTLDATTQKTVLTHIRRDTATQRQQTHNSFGSDSLLRLTHTSAASDSLVVANKLVENNLGPLHKPLTLTDTLVRINKKDSLGNLMTSNKKLAAVSDTLLVATKALVSNKVVAPKTTAAVSSESNGNDNLSAENTILKNRLALQEAQRPANANSVGNGYTATTYPESYNAKQQEAKTAIVPVPMGNFNATPTSQLTDTVAKDSVYVAKSGSAIDSIQQKLSAMQAQLNKLSLQAQIAQENTKLNNQGSAAPILMQQQYLQEQIGQLQQKNKLLSDSLAKQITKIVKKDPQRLAIYFKINETKIDHQAAQQLKNYATTIKSQRPKWILLEGFTDKSGNPAYNLILSQQRVAAVKAFLVKLGVASSQLLEKNFGSKFATEKRSDSERKVSLSLWYE